MRAVRRSLFLLAASATFAVVTAQAPATAKKPITLEVMKAWNSVAGASLSNDGRWFVYTLAPREGDSQVILRGTAADAKETRYPVGDGGGQPQLSGDAKWLGFMVSPNRPPQGRAGRAGGEGAAATPSAARKFALLNVASGEKKEFDRVARFEFNNSDAPTWVAMQMAPAGAAAPAGGAAPAGRGGGGGGAGGAAPSRGDLLIHRLGTGETINLGPVSSFSFDRSGDLLAYTLDSPDQVGNGVQLRNMRTDVVRSIDSERALYRGLTWADTTVQMLAVLRARIDTVTRDTLAAIVTFSQFSAAGPAKKTVFDPAGRTDFPAGMKIALDRAPRFSADLASVFYGIREARKTPAQTIAANGGPNLVEAGAPGAGGSVNQPNVPNANSEEGDPSLILWHGKDTRLQSQQIVQESQDRNFNYLSVYHLADNRAVRLADDEIRMVNFSSGDRFAYGVDNREYQHAASYSGRNFNDVYAIDLKTGARTPLLKKHPNAQLRSSPDGRRAAYWGTDGHWHVLDFATGASKNVSANAGVSFVNVESDINNLFPPSYAFLGWSKDGSSLLLSDGWDIHRLPAAGGAAVNLTGNGRRDGIRYQRVLNFGERAQGGAFGNSTQNGVDLSRPLLVAMYGEWTKKEGVARVDASRPGAQPLFFEPARFNVQRAQNADVFIATRQTFTEFPDYHVVSADWRTLRPLTNANPQLAELAWSSGTRLIDYVTDKGDKLQGAMYLPANFDPSKKYPMLVTIYEKRSQNLNGFVSPSETRTPDPALYTSRGYVVFDPDIVYKINDPGMSAVWAVVPAVKAAIATGFVDEKNVGLWGHSWGGYQTSFLITQTDMFKAAIAGAPLTDMVSMYSSIYWNTGGTNQAIFESSQGRFKGNFIENYDAYIRNSPLFHADKVKTPLIILHNDKDGAVDFNQGVIYYNTLRQLGKDVIMLEYVGENHGLERPVNQKDYAGRMTEYFDHHLKGMPAADWIQHGVPRLKMGEHFESRKTPPKITP